MTARTRRVLTAAVVAPVLAAVTAALAGCGVPSDRTARQVDPPPGPYRVLTSATLASPEPGTSPERLYFVKDNLLVPVVRQVRTEPTVEALVRDLLAGPTGAERDTGLTSALLGTDVIAGLRTDNGRVEVELSVALEGAGRTDEVLALAQIVCTLTARPGVTGVAFTRDGKRIGVPRADGSLSQGPLTAADYANLLAGR